MFTYMTAAITLFFGFGKTAYPWIWKDQPLGLVPIPESLYV